MLLLFLQKSPRDRSRTSRLPRKINLTQPNPLRHTPRLTKAERLLLNTHIPAFMCTSCGLQHVDNPDLPVCIHAANHKHVRAEHRHQHKMYAFTKGSIRDMKACVVV